MKPPVIVIPGITATDLRDYYPLDPERIWGLPLTRDYRRVALHPDDLRFEQLEPAQVRADQAAGIAYDEYVKELRHDLTRNPDRPRPVHVFGYDWRQPLTATVRVLEEFVEEVVRRTKLLPHYHAANYRDDPAVDLVGHSMGGLLIAGYLQRTNRRRVRKIVTMGTPFRGSFEAVLQIITGTAQLGGGVPSSREREVARVTPGVYHLLPDIPGRVLRDDASLPRSLFDEGLWQQGVIDSIATHIRRFSLRAPDTDRELERAAVEFLEKRLTEAREYRELTESTDLEDAGLTPDDWLAIVGVGDETRVQLFVQAPEEEGERPRFDLRSADRRNQYPDPDNDDVQFDTGDGTVPYLSALPTFLPDETPVLVSPDDWGYWEQGLIRWFTGLHGLLPRMNRVIKLSAAFLNGEAGQKAQAHAGIQGRPPIGMDPDDWDPPFVGLENAEE